MFFIISKLIGFICQPFYWIVILFIISWWTKRPRLKKWTLRIGIGSLIFFTNTVIFCEFARMWEPDGKKITEVEHYDVAIVLGGMAEYDRNNERLSLRRGADRIWQTIHLYQLGKVDKILISGANGDLVDKGLNEAVQFRNVLLDFGIPSEDILVDSISKNTYENAVESKKIIDNHAEIKTCILVTSALHMPRSKACFDKVGFTNIETFTTDHFTGKKRGYQFDQILIPNPSNFQSWSNLMHEWFGYITYWIMGYL